MMGPTLAEMQRAVSLMAKTQARLIARLQGVEAALQAREQLPAKGSALPCRPKRPPTPAEREQVARAVREAERRTGVSGAQIRSSSRYRPIVRARWLAMRIAHDGGLSVAGIGRALGMDHTTVIHGLRQCAVAVAGEVGDDQA